MNPKPKILIDSVSLLSPLTGIGRYTYEVAQKLDKHHAYEIDYFYGYYSSQLMHPKRKSEIKNLKSIITSVPLLKKIARKALFLSSQMFGKRYKLYWQPNFIPNKGIKADHTVTSVHDFSFLLHKEFHPKERIEYFEKNFFKNIKKSDMIITGSEFSKREILEKLEVTEDKVKVIYHGVNHHLFKVYHDLEVSFTLPQKFIFSVGSIEPRKNLLGLLKAYNQLAPSLKKEYKLVLVGFKGWENREIMEIIEKNTTHIHYLGFISDEELAKVYNLASCFVFPSFYEGFGLPVLEAMACGTPVVCSDSSSLPEVGGDAVLYCDAHNVDDIQSKIEDVLENEALQNTMITKGIERAQTFSWEKSTLEHIEVFEMLLALKHSK